MDRRKTSAGLRDSVGEGGQIVHFYRTVHVIRKKYRGQTFNFDR